jgi:sugar phosphate isomerase/epimerase
MYSRRHFIKVAAAGLALSPVLEAKINSRVHGVYVGLQTYSLRGLRYEPVIAAMKQIGLGECELWSTQVEPTRADVPDIAKWRSTVSLDFFTDVRKKFNQAGIEIYAYNPTFGAGGGGRGRGARGTGADGAPPPPPPAPITDVEIDRIFQMSKALGAKTINSGIQPEVAKRVAPFAEKYKMEIGIFSQDADVLAMSKYFKYDIDIGNYTRAGNDALKFVQDNLGQLTDIHLKDCKLKGASVPFGEGDSHMKEILQLLKNKKSKVRANIDCDYPGTGTSVEEVQKCYDYVKSCLA